MHNANDNNATQNNLPIDKTYTLLAHAISTSSSLINPLYKKFYSIKSIQTADQLLSNLCELNKLENEKNDNSKKSIQDIFYEFYSLSNLSHYYVAYCKSNKAYLFFGKGKELKNHAPFFKGILKNKHETFYNLLFEQLNSKKEKNDSLISITKTYIDYLNAVITSTMPDWQKALAKQFSDFDFDKTVEKARERQNEISKIYNNYIQDDNDISDKTDNEKDKSQDELQTIEDDGESDEFFDAIDNMADDTIAVNEDNEKDVLYYDALETQENEDANLTVNNTTVNFNNNSSQSLCAEKTPQKIIAPVCRKLDTTDDIIEDTKLVSSLDQLDGQINSSMDINRIIKKSTYIQHPANNLLHTLSKYSPTLDDLDQMLSKMCEQFQKYKKKREDVSIRRYLNKLFYKKLIDGKIKIVDALLEKLTNLNNQGVSNLNTEKKYEIVTNLGTVLLAAKNEHKKITKNSFASGGNLGTLLTNNLASLERNYPWSLQKSKEAFRENSAPSILYKTSANNPNIIIDNRAALASETSENKHSFSLYQRFISFIKIFPNKITGKNKSQQLIPSGLHAIKNESMNQIASNSSQGHEQESSDTVSSSKWLKKNNETQSSSINGNKCALFQNSCNETSQSSSAASEKNKLLRYK